MDNENDIEQFLVDVREHFRASLETSEYENTSNMFHVTAADATVKLLQRCELLLQRCWTSKQFCNERGGPTKAAVVGGTHVISQINMPKESLEKQFINPNPAVPNQHHLINGGNNQEESVSYMEMSATSKKVSMTPLDYTDFNTSADSDKTFRCSTRLATNHNPIKNIKNDNETIVNTHSDEADDEGDDDNDDGQQIYDICHVTHQELPTDETQMVINAEMELIQSPDCPYKDLPAGHLAIQKSCKYGQLQRIEKRLFFDQSKKCYSGILDDWLLVYVDGPTASCPTITLHLKSPGIEIEHFGEGKRRDVCFQITTADPNKKFIFQAANEVDAKEWIHAIEAAIRGDTTAITPTSVGITTSTGALATINKSTRKLPTPPTIKKMTFLSSSSSSHSCLNSINIKANSNDCIYEEPSPLYEIQSTLANLSDKYNSSIAIAKKYEYDVPKCPPQPLKSIEQNAETEIETISLLNAQPLQQLQLQPTKQLGETQQVQQQQSSTTTFSNSLSEKSNDFQAKIKDVHSKLSSQLTAGPQKKTTKKGYINTPTQDDTEDSPTATPLSNKEQKKQKKSTTPTSSPQKCNVIGSNSPQEKSTKNWFLNRLNKSTSSMRSNSSNSGSISSSNSRNCTNHPSSCAVQSLTTSPNKSKQSENENLLNSLDLTDSYDLNTTELQHLRNSNSHSASPASTKCSGKSKVNMIINQLEASGHLATMFSVETLASNALATFSAAFCESDCNNYEPIMTVSPPPSSFLKKV